MSATVSISSTLTMRPMDLWHCYKTASPCVPEPRPWPTPEPAPASASCNQTNAPAQALSPIHDGGVGVWKVQVALSRLEFKLALAGKAKTGGYMRSLELSKDKNVRPGEHLKRSTNKATARYTASMALDGIWEEEATPSKHDDTRPSMGAEAAQSEQSTAEAVCREDKMSYSKVDDKEESSRSAGKRVMTDTGSQDRDSRPLASLETRLQRIGKKCTKAEMQIARAKSFMGMERHYAQDQPDSSKPLASQNNASNPKRDSNISNSKHHCIVSGHVFRPIKLSSLPETAAIKGIPAWWINARGDIEAVPVRIECDACGLDIEDTVWQCDIPVCGHEVCWECAQRLEEETMDRAVESWNG